MSTNLEVHNKRHLPDYNNVQHNQAIQSQTNEGGSPLPSLVKLGKQIPIAVQVATYREAQSLKLVVERRRKEWLHLNNELAYIQSLHIPQTRHLEALNYCYKLQEQLDTLTAIGKQEAAELAAFELPESLKQMPEAIAELKVAELIIQLFILMGTDEKKQDEFPTEAAAAIIVKRFGWMSLNQIAQVLFKVIVGELVVYGKLTLPQLCQWLQEFTVEYKAAWESHSYGQHVQSKANGEGNRGWQIREANCYNAKVQARKSKAREVALYKLEIQSAINSLQQNIK